MHMDVLWFSADPQRGRRSMKSRTVRLGQRFTLWIGSDALFFPRLQIGDNHRIGSQIAWLWFAFNIVPSCNGRSCPCAGLAAAARTRREAERKAARR